MPTLEELQTIRRKKLERLREEGAEVFPAATNRTHAAEEAVNQFEDLSGRDERVVLAGRIRALREHGGATFVDVEDGTGRLQWFIEEDTVGAVAYTLLLETMDVGDIIEGGGTLFTTKRGEQTLKVEEWRVLAKSLRPLPEEWFGFKNVEERFRRRYVDLLMNPEQKEMFRRKARFWRAMRQYMLDSGFLEVETPILETTTGGADAEPFVTHHNALDIDVYLRISMGELWQKRLMVAGFDKTFEIGRQFRNEGISPEHLQDYTQMEFYWAYADYRDAMAFVEELYKHIIRETWSATTVTIGDFSDIVLDGAWKEIDYVEEIQKQTDIDILAASEEELRSVLDERGVVHGDLVGRGRLMDAVWKQCRKSIKGPAFVVHHPVDVSPLAKRHRERPNVTERFQVIIAGSELGNGYSELNDPLDQAERFREQARLREEGDVEAQMHDRDFVEALEYGMPPTAGFGVSERLFSFLENKPIRETVLFPLLRPKDGSDNSNTPK